MEGKKNLNWEISVLEAQAGEGRSMWKAKAKEAKRKRLEEKRAKKTSRKLADEPASEPPGSETKKADIAPSDASARLQALRLEKTKRKMHTVQKRSAAVMRKVIGLEKQRLVRKAKSARKQIEELDATKGSSSVSKQREDAEKDIAKCEDDLKYLASLSIAALEQCVVCRIFKRSPVLREALGPATLTKEAEATNADPRVQQRVLGSAKAISYVKGAIVDMEGALSGISARKEPKAERRTEGKKAQASDDNDDDESGVAAGASDAESESEPEASTFIANLGGDASDISLSESEDESESESKAPAAKKGERIVDNYEEEDENFAKIYGTAKPKNRPGQRARRQQYEKMYGDEANHVKLTKKVSKKDTGKRPTETRGQHNPAASTKKPRHDAGDAAPPAKASSVHPSWEAKRREKELLAKAKTVKPTKIVFD